jgi:hypothetical protein
MEQAIFDTGSSEVADLKMNKEVMIQVLPNTQNRQARITFYTHSESLNFSNYVFVAFHCCCCRRRCRCEPASAMGRY